MARRSKLEIELCNLWNSIGTIYFKNYDELCMLLGVYDKSKVRKLISSLDRDKKIYLDFDYNTWVLDYIGF